MVVANMVIRGGGLMYFEPRPDFEFGGFYNTYYERCAAVCLKLAAIAAKWQYEDLILGLSDFDTRLIFHDGVSYQRALRRSARF